MLKFILRLIAFSFFAALFFGAGWFLANSGNTFYASNPTKEKLNRLIDFIDNEYVDTVNTEEIVDKTVNSILSELDPHSVYIPKSDMTEVAEQMRGDFVGIGVTFRMKQDTATVVKVIKGGPSEIAGLLPGDKIMIADKDTLYNKEIASGEIVTRLKGEKNSQVELEIYRKAVDSALQVTINRGDVPIVSVNAKYMLSDNMGYIQLNRFAESSYTEFKLALESLISRGAEKLVFDLRGNPGGYIGIAEQIADEFLEANQMIVYTKDKTGRIEKSFASSLGVFENQPVYVLIDESSASASEIIAGALQDNDLGTIVGRRSFGKGLVQREMELGDGSAVRLTISRYYTPTGRSIQRPYQKGKEDYYMQIYDRYDSGEMDSADNIEVNDSLRFLTPKGKVVYGGGGIIPDVFVAVENTTLETLKMLDEETYISNFVFNYLERNRKRYYNFTKQEFLNDFNFTDDEIKSFIDDLKSYGFVLNQKQYGRTINTLMKANMADQLFDSNIAAQLRGTLDPMLEKVLEIENSQ